MPTTFSFNLFCLLLCLSKSYMPRACGRQKRASDSLELELEMAVSHVGAGNHSQVLWKSSQCF
ncbi:hypothetical protein ACRRTK_013864 [Alexandromys fortis]